MNLWTTSSVDVHCSAIMGLTKFSTSMRKAILHVQLTKPECIMSPKRECQPLESKTMRTDESTARFNSAPFEVLTCCAQESYAVVDTGCQRTAIGVQTLQNIISRLPPELNVKYEKQSFRFTGIGGETISTRVALLPVCFGRRPGVIRTAILEDCPNAPFLLSLPILRALGAQVDLKQEVMRFQELGETGQMFFNAREQMCLRLFDFEQIGVARHRASHHWTVRKIIGDECRVFMLTNPNSVQFQEPDQCNRETSDCLVYKGDHIDGSMIKGNDCVEEDQYQSNLLPEQPNPSCTFHHADQTPMTQHDSPHVDSQSTLVSSIAETPEHH